MKIHPAGILIGALGLSAVYYGLRMRQAAPQLPQTMRTSAPVVLTKAEARQLEKQQNEARSAQLEFPAPQSPGVMI